jgi:hypothetical protein
MSYFKATMSMEVNLSKLSKRPTLGSFKISQCRGIPPNRFLTRLKTYEKLVGTRKKSIFGVFIPAPKIGKIKVKIPFKSVKISKSQISKHVMYTLSLINLILQNVRARFFMLDRSDGLDRKQNKIFTGGVSHEKKVLLHTFVTK